MDTPESERSTASISLSYATKCWGMSANSPSISRNGGVEQGKKERDMPVGCFHPARPPRAVLSKDAGAQCGEPEGDTETLVWQTL